MKLVELKLSDEPGDVVSVNPEMVVSVSRVNNGKECYVWLADSKYHPSAEPYAEVVAKLTGTIGGR